MVILVSVWVVSAVYRLNFLIRQSSIFAKQEKNPQVTVDPLLDSDSQRFPSECLNVRSYFSSMGLFSSIGKAQAPAVSS